MPAHDGRIEEDDAGRSFISKIQHYTLQCHSSLPCAPTLSAHSLALVGIYSSHRGLQRLRGRSSQQKGSAGQLLWWRGAILSMTWRFTGPGYTWALYQLFPITSLVVVHTQSPTVLWAKQGDPSKQNCIVKRAPKQLSGWGGRWEQQAQDFW